MRKYREATWKNGYVKYYRCDKRLSPVQFLEHLASKGWKFDKVFMKRDAEMDMQFGIGNYTLEELKQSQEYPDHGPARMFTLQACLDCHSAEIHFTGDSEIVYMVTAEHDLELE